MRHPALWLALAGLALFAVATLSGHGEWLDISSRILVYALAAASLDLLVGFGGMVSFGHATFLLAGAYTVGILGAEGVGSAWVQWPAAILVSSLLAAGIGALSLRAGGVYFIMLTLAFSQMVYFIFVGLSRYGGDDGLQIYPRSSLPFGVDLDDPNMMYLTVLAVVALGFFALTRLVESHFGLVLRGCRQNEVRMRALGFRTYRYRLAAFTVAGAVCGVAGLLLANVSGFISPSLGGWEKSGELLVMVIVGGQGTLSGAIFGALILIGLESWLSEQTAHWPLAIGLILLVVALRLPNGVRSLLAWRSAKHG